MFIVIGQDWRHGCCKETVRIRNRKLGLGGGVIGGQKSKKISATDLDSDLEKYHMGAIRHLNILCCVF